MGMTGSSSYNAWYCLVGALVLATALLVSGAAEADDLLWVKQAGGSDEARSYGIAVDATGNSYVTGSFPISASSGMIFGAGEANETTLTHAANNTSFVARYNPDGDLLWAKQVGGSGSGIASGIAVDGSGNSYVTARSDVFGEYDFVAKYDSDGNLLWAKQAGGSVSGMTVGGSGSGIAVDGSGNSYVTGTFSSPAIFGVGEANETILTSPGFNNIFVAKYDPDGSLLWAKQAFGAPFGGIAADSSGNSYVSGWFSGSAIFGFGEANGVTLTAIGTEDIFVAKYDPNGNLLWAKQAGGSGPEDVGQGIAVDGSGNSYVTGSFRDSVTFGTGEANETTLTSGGFRTIFVAKYDPEGNLLWAKQAGGIVDRPFAIERDSADQGRAIAVDGLGNSYVTGSFFCFATFGAGEANEVTLTSPCSEDIFLAKYDPNGNLLYATSAGGVASFEYGNGIAVGGSDNVYVTGWFGQFATFGASEGNETTLSPTGGRDIFVAKYGPLRSATVVDANGTGPVLAGGVETHGLARGPAFQLFDTAGNTLAGQFALSPDFTGISFVRNSQILVGGRETRGLARGPAFQLFASNGNLQGGAFVLNPDFTGIQYSIGEIASPGVLVCGLETGGLARGPAFQIFDENGNLLTGSFALNADFTTDNQCLTADLDGVAGDEVIVGARDAATLGPAYQVWDKNGNLLFGRLVLNADFSEVRFGVANVASNGVLVVGRETGGLARGPALQLFDSGGTLLAGAFVLGPDFTGVEAFGANTTNGMSGDEIVVVGRETGGSARGSAFQIWDRLGSLLLERFVLTPDFTGVLVKRIDINNDGVDEILVGGRETGGPARGPAVQVWAGSGNLLASFFVLNGDFSHLSVFAIDQNGDGDEEIGVGGVETGSALRGPAYQIFESDGTLIGGRFVLNADF